MVQISSIWRTGSFLPTLAPANCMQAASGTCAQLAATRPRGGGWLPTTVLRAEIDQNEPKKNFFIGVKLLYNVVLVSAVQ